MCVLCVCMCVCVCVCVLIIQVVYNFQVLLKGLGRLVCLYYEDFLCVDSTPDHIFDQYATSLDTISQGSANHPLDDAKVIREYNSHVVHRAEWRQLAAVVDRIFCLVFWAASIIFIVAMAIKL